MLAIGTVYTRMCVFVSVFLLNHVDGIFLCEIFCVSCCASRIFTVRWWSEILGVFFSLCPQVVKNFEAID
jgi:hypothetical protein